MRSQNEVKDEVLARAGRYRVVHPQRSTSDAPAVEGQGGAGRGHRYIVCLNDDEARKDAADREAIVASLREKLRTGEKRWSATRAIAATSIRRGRITSRLTRRRSRRRLATTASGYSGPIRIWSSRGGAAVQAVMDGGGLVPLDQVAVADSADLSQVRRNDPWSRLLLVPGVGAAQEVEVRLAKDGHDFEWADVIQDLAACRWLKSSRMASGFCCGARSGHLWHSLSSAGVAVPPTVQQAPKDPADLDRNPSATPHKSVLLHYSRLRLYL